jgi:hypothetical protein
MVSRTPEAGVVRVTPADIPFYVCICLAYSACGPDATFWNRTPRIKDTRKPDSEFTMLNSVSDRLPVRCRTEVDVYLFRFQKGAR